jgi:hypothetical protein
MFCDGGTQPYFFQRAWQSASLAVYGAPPRKVSSSGGLAGSIVLSSVFTILKVLAFIINPSLKCHKTKLTRPMRKPQKQTTMHAMAGLGSFGLDCNLSCMEGMS